MHNGKNLRGVTALELLKIFREDVGEVVGAYFDGEKIFLACSAENFATIELDAAGAELDDIAEKISVACRQRGRKISAVGFCLRESDAVTYQKLGGGTSGRGRGVCLRDGRRRNLDGNLAANQA